MQSRTKITLIVIIIALIMIYMYNAVHRKETYLSYQKPMYALSNSSVLLINTRYGWIPLPLSYSQNVFQIWSDRFGFRTNNREFEALVRLLGWLKIVERDSGGDRNYFALKNATTYLFGKRGNVTQTFDYMELSCERLGQSERNCKQFSANLRGYQKKINNKLNKKTADRLRNQIKIRI